MSKVWSFILATGRRIKTILTEAGDWIYAIWITFMTKEEEDDQA